MTDDEKIDFGPCCACGKEDESVRNIMMFHKKALNPEGGWGCVICGVRGGAVAIICDECLEKNAEIKFVCDGYPKNGKIIAIDQLTEPFDHDWSKHHPAEFARRN